MKQIFSYNKFNEDVADGLVETCYSLAQKSIEGKNNTPEYVEANKTFNEEFMKYCVENAGMKWSGLDMIKNPMVYKKSGFLETFDTILAGAITPVVPTVAAAGYEQLYDITQVGFGDVAKYEVDSNELFIVNSLAEGIARGGVQTASNTEYTISAKREQISLYVDWYHVAAGRTDWGKLLQKIGASFAAYIQARLAKVMATIITNNTNGKNEDGIAGYMANGLTDENWLKVARLVKLANGGADVYALGTSIALASVLPDSAKGFRYGEDSAIVKDGFLPDYKNVPLIELGNALVPNTINGEPEVVLPDDIIYFLPLGMNKPIKVVMEGNTVSVEKDPLFAADHTYGFTVDMRMGMDAIVGSKAGAITLN